MTDKSFICNLPKWLQDIIYICALIFCGIILGYILSFALSICAKK